MHVGDNIFIIADSPDGQSLRFVSAPFYVDIVGNIKKLIPDRQENIRYAFSVKRYKLFGKYGLYFWDIETGSFSKVNLCSKTLDTHCRTGCCSSLPGSHS